MSIPIKERRVTDTEYDVVDYSPDAIREIWSDDTAETSLVLALLERWEAAESNLARLKAESDRMRPVYEAAVSYTTDCGGIGAIIDATNEALAAALTTKEQDDGKA